MREPSPRRPCSRRSAISGRTATVALTRVGRPSFSSSDFDLRTLDRFEIVLADARAHRLPARRLRWPACVMAPDRRSARRLCAGPSLDESPEAARFLRGCERRAPRPRSARRRRSESRVRLASAQASHGRGGQQLAPVNENEWSGRRDSNSRPSPWQGDALPLSYFRRFVGRHAGVRAPRLPGQAETRTLTGCPTGS